MKKIKNLTICLICICFFSSVMATHFKIKVRAVEDSDVQDLIEMNILSGYSDGSLHLENKITRAEFAKMVYVLTRGTDDLGLPFMKQESQFIDIQNNNTYEWAKGYIYYCQDKQFIVGSNQRFRPSDNITLAEASKVLLTVLGLNPSEEGLVGLGWAENSIKKGYENGILAEDYSDNSVAVTRNQVSQMIIRILGDITHSEQNINDYVVILQSDYDQQQKIATVKLGDRKEPYKVSNFYINNEKYPNSYLNDTAEKFGNNNKVGYIYRAVISGDNVDLSLEKGVAPNLNGNPELDKGTFFLGNNSYETTDDTKVMFIMETAMTWARGLETISFTMRDIKNIKNYIIMGYQVPLKFGDVTWDKPFGTVLTKKTENGRKAFICMLTTSYKEDTWYDAP